MIIVHKAIAMIGRKTLCVYVHVELDGDNEEEYIPEYGAVINTDEIATIALRQSSCFEDKTLYGVFGKALKEYIEVDLDEDDAYEYQTIEDMLKARDPKRHAGCCVCYQEIEEKQEIVNYNNKPYNVHIDIFIER